MRKPDLSFVVPAYQAEEYLAFSIGSCLAQSHKSIEVIVVNDGSTDATRRIIDWYAAKDPRVRPVHFELNQGRGKARNLGTALAQAPYIAVLDADDESEGKRAETTLALFREHPEALVYGSCAFIDCVGFNNRTGLAGPFDLKHSMKTKANYMVHSSLAYPKAFWEQHPYDEGEYAALGLDDWLFELKAVLAGLKPVFTEKVLCGYRFNRLGISQTRDVKKVDELKDKFLSTLPEYKALTDEKPKEPAAA